MKKRGLFFLVLVAIGSSLGAISARAQDTDDPKKWSDSFCETLLDKDDSISAKQLSNTFAGKNVAHFAERVLDEFHKLDAVGGAFTGYEYVSQSSLGTRLRRYTYVAFSERFFTALQFSFYKGSHGWELFGVDLNSASDTVPWQ